MFRVVVKMIGMYLIRKLLHCATGGVKWQGVRKYATKANYSKLSTSSSLSEYTRKFIFVGILLATLVGGCIEEEEKIEELLKIGPFLEDELNNYKADDDLELIISTFEELTDKQKEILSNFGEIKDSIPPISGKGLIESEYWRTTFVTKKVYLGNISKIDFVDKIEKLPSDSEYLGKTRYRLVPFVIASPNNKSMNVFIEFKHELGESEFDQFKKLEVVLYNKSTLESTQTIGYTATIPVKNMARVLGLDFVNSIEVEEGVSEPKPGH